MSAAVVCAGLDAQVEHALHQTLGTLRVGRLSLLISHRLSALTSADLILVLDGGRIRQASIVTSMLNAIRSAARSAS